MAQMKTILIRSVEIILLRFLAEQGGIAFSKNRSKHKRCIAEKRHYLLVQKLCF